jgi:hypothetical protein
MIAGDLGLAIPALPPTISNDSENSNQTGSLTVDFDRLLDPTTVRG